ncbi:MAG TPA: class I adenylate-forming enzyme family protein, partial [Acidimicrobiales bacterium]|nr:class I adenylate-forming enzyme family protein [Acidimicrobiales bacterium]
RFRAGEATHVVHDSGARALIFSSSLGDVAHGIDGLDELQTIVCIGGGDRPRGGLAYEPLIAHATPLAVPARVAPSDLAIIGYTSGTTGFPKGAQCSHRAVVTCTQLVPYVQGMVTNGSCTFIGSFSFVSALWGILLPHLWTGATMRLAGAADVDAWVAHLERDDATYTWVPSPLVRAFRDALVARPGALANLRTVVHTGSKVPREFLASLVDVIGDQLIETWGLTESIGPLTATTRADLDGACRADDVLASVGRPVPTAEVAVLDAAGHPSTAPGLTGEFVARADTLFSGYLGRPVPDLDAFTADGWFRTGDVGRFDDAGYAYIEDRCKDVVVSGGMNVYPAEVELAILTLPGVAECAVFGVPDDRWGETVAAAVVAEPGAALTGDAVVAHVQARLASFKKPTVVRFVDSLPRNASMKVQKQVLREQFVAAG